MTAIYGQIDMRRIGVAIKEGYSTMKREIGLVGAIFMGISGAMGFEIFVLMDYAYFHLAGPSIVLALLLGGLINLLIMLSYCELSAAIPEVGGEYTYIKTAFGGFVSFMSGCLRWLASIFGAALAALTFFSNGDRSLAPRG